MIKSAASALACGVCMVAMAAPAQAQTREYNVPAGSLKQALDVYAQQSGRQIIYKLDEVRPVSSPGTKGTKTADAALASILANTGFQASKDRSGAIAIVKQGGSGAAQAMGPSGDGKPVPVTGTVTDERTGANLKGALIAIEEAGQTTQTDDLGSYRFPGVRPGRYTLRISYLGYRDIVTTLTVEARQGSKQTFAMTGGADEEIIVYGTRAGRAQSLNQQRTAQNNSEVVSADLLGNFTGTTISEALRRVPGVTFQQDPVTGEGTNIIVRGLEPDLNTVKLNGLRIPDNSGTGRSGDLSNILADSVSKITVHKSLLPSQDSTGTGGLVEIETKSPLDRRRRYANFSLEGGKSGRGFNDDLLASGTISGKFGAEENFGLSGSVQYRNRNFSTIVLSQDLIFGQYLPLSPAGTTSITRISQIDPRRNFPFEEGASSVYPTGLQVISNDGKTSNLSATLSAEWKIADHSELQIDAIHTIAKRKNLYRNASHFFTHSYTELPVVGLGGESRQSLVFKDSIRLSQTAQAIDNKDVNSNISFRGKTNIGNWSAKYNAGYTKGTSSSNTTSLSFNGRVFGLDPSFVLPIATDPIEGRIVSIFSPISDFGPQAPLLTQSGFDALNAPGSYSFGNALVDLIDRGFNERVTGQMSGRYSFPNETIKYLEAGLFYERATFTTPPYLDKFNFYFGTGSTIVDFAGRFDHESLGRIGVNQGIKVLTPSIVVGTITKLTELVDAGLVIPFQFDSQDARLAEQFTKERELSGYIEGALDIGAINIIGGIRINTVSIQSRQLSSPRLKRSNGTTDFLFQQENTEVVELRDNVTDILPRVIVNYRPSDNVIVRGGYFLSIARPTLDSLSRTPLISLDLRPIYGPASNQPKLSIGIGNPGLEPASTHNFDVSFERYSNDVGLSKLSLFYKRINNFLQSSSLTGFSILDDVPLPDDPRFTSLPENIFISASRPGNAGGVAEIWGFDASIEHRFNSLPGLLGGLGIFMNYTYSDSSREVEKVWNDSPVFDVNGKIIGSEQVEHVLDDVPFAQQAKHSGTAAVTYNRNNVDASISYTRQARRLRRIGDNGINQYQEATDSLDFRAEYRLTTSSFGQYRVWIEGLDLLHGPNNPTLVSTTGGYFSSGNYIGGRSFKAGISTTF